MVFDTASVKNIIIRVTNEENKKNTRSKKVLSSDEFKSHVFEESIVDQNIFLKMQNQCFKTNGFQDVMTIKKKIEENTIFLEDICLIAYGVRINSKTDKDKPKKYFLSEHKIDGFKPFIEGKNIQRYSHQQNGWLNYCPKEHYNSMFTELFENEKIIFINVVSDRLRFSYDIEGLYNSHTVINCVKIDSLLFANHISARKAVEAADMSLVKRYNIKFILAILNSKLINWYFMQFQTDGLHIYPDSAKKIPIIDVRIMDVEQEKIIDLVDEILSKKKAGICTIELEQKIDQMIYGIYKIKDDDIKIIEESEK
ncbi:MAG: TaqI-like C-terminal specificity domain-containing protein [Mobilitalea sp.]